MMQMGHGNKDIDITEWGCRELTLRLPCRARALNFLAKIKAAINLSGDT